MDTCNEIYDVKTIFMNDNYNCTMYYGVSFNTYYEANNLFKNLNLIMFKTSFIIILKMSEN